MTDKNSHSSAAPAHSATALEVKCPGCGQTAIYAPSNPYRPFCSQRCKSLDLGAWATEQFRVEAREDPDDAEEAGDPQPDAGSDWRH